MSRTSRPPSHKEITEKADETKEKAQYFVERIHARRGPERARGCCSTGCQTTVPHLAPLEQYLMDRDAEIALARSAAPDTISHDASVIVLTRHGYETAVEGKNGWVCWAGRGWMAMFDHPEFWNPKVRAAECLNPPAARSVLP